MLGFISMVVKADVYDTIFRLDHLIFLAGYRVCCFIFLNLTMKEMFFKKYD